MVQKIHLAEVHGYGHFVACSEAGILALEFAAKEFHGVGRLHDALERIAGALFAHYLDIVRIDGQAHLRARLKRIVVLHHQFIALVGIHEHFVMYSLENTGLHYSRELRMFNVT